MLVLGSLRLHVHDLFCSCCTPPGYTIHIEINTAVRFVASVNSIFGLLVDICVSTSFMRSSSHVALAE